MSELNEIQYWHDYQDGGNNKCAKILAGHIPCGGGRNQHDDFTVNEYDLPSIHAVVDSTREEDE